MRSNFTVLSHSDWYFMPRQSLLPSDVKFMIPFEGPLREYLFLNPRDPRDLDGEERTAFDVRRADAMKRDEMINEARRERQAWDKSWLGQGGLIQTGILPEQFQVMVEISLTETGEEALQTIRAGYVWNVATGKRDLDRTKQHWTKSLDWVAKSKSLWFMENSIIQSCLALDDPSMQEIVTRAVYLKMLIPHKETTG